MTAHAPELATARFPLWLRLLLAPLVAVLVLVGIWVAGGLLTNDFRFSMLLTALWLGFAGLTSALVGWRWRPLALPVLGTFLLAAGGAGGYLLYASKVDKVVNEEVAVADVPAPGSQTGSQPDRAAENIALTSGRFTSGEHATSGKATIIRLPEGGTVLTLTDFDTSPGPDLRVYLVTGSADDLGDVVDLGGLKGNKGNQQYDVPARLDTRKYGTVVIWCRAFSVAFGSARLV